MVKFPALPTRERKKKTSSPRSPESPPRDTAPSAHESGTPPVLTGTAQAVPPFFVSALRRVLRPLARLLLDFQVPFPYASGVLKAIYVEVAAAERTLEGRRQTDSRVSLLTGVHRKDVKRLREEPHEDRSAPESVSLGAQIVQRWTTDARYLDDDFRPRPLPRSALGARTPSFDHLVESVSKDIRARAVLDEWVHLGIARVDAEGLVHLRVEGFVPERGMEEKAFYFGRNVSHHIAAAAHNLRGEQPPLLERTVSYGGLRQESVAELEALANELSMEVLRSVNQRAAALQRRDARRKKGRRMRISLGTYFFKVSDDSEDRS